MQLVPSLSVVAASLVMALPVSSVGVDVATPPWSVVVTRFVRLVVSASGSVTSSSVTVVRIPAVVLSLPVGENTWNMLHNIFLAAFKVYYKKIIKS